VLHALAKDLRDRGGIDMWDFCRALYVPLTRGLWTMAYKPSTWQCQTALVLGSADGLTALFVSVVGPSLREAWQIDDFQIRSLICAAILGRLTNDDARFVWTDPALRTLLAES